MAFFSKKTPIATVLQRLFGSRLRSESAASPSDTPKRKSVEGCPIVEIWQPLTASFGRLRLVVETDFLYAIEVSNVGLAAQQQVARRAVESFQAAELAAFDIIYFRIGHCIGRRDDAILAAATIDDGTVYKNRHIGAAVDFGFVALFQQFQFEHYAAVAVLVLLVGEEIAQRVDYWLGIAVVVGIGIDDKVLHHVGMCTNHSTTAVVEQPTGDALLFFVAVTLVFYAPVHQGYDKVSTIALCLFDILQHLHSIDQIDNIRLGHIDSICSISVVEQRQTDAVAADNQRIAFHSLLLVGVGAKMRNVERVEDAEGAFDAAASLVHTVVVGGGEDVETCVASSSGVGIRRRKAGKTSIWFASQGDFEIQYRQVSRLDIVFYITETGLVVVAAVGLLRRLVQRHMSHQVAGKDKAQMTVARLSCGTAGNSQKHQATEPLEAHSVGFGGGYRLMKVYLRNALNVGLYHNVSVLYESLKLRSSS